jgi:hypothetical protein
VNSVPQSDRRFETFAAPVADRCAKFDGRLGAQRAGK